MPIDVVTARRTRITSVAFRATELIRSSQGFPVPREASG